jgi:hypothetical protein
MSTRQEQSSNKQNVRKNRGKKQREETHSCRNESGYLPVFAIKEILKYLPTRELVSHGAISRNWRNATQTVFREFSSVERKDLCILWFHLRTNESITIRKILTSGWHHCLDAVLESHDATQRRLRVRGKNWQKEYCTLPFRVRDPLARFSTIRRFTAWLDWHGGYVENFSLANSMMRIVAETNDLAVLRWLDEYLKHGKKTNCIHWNLLFNTACSEGSLEVAQWIHSRGYIDISTLYTVLMTQVLPTTHVPVARWLLEQCIASNSLPLSSQVSLDEFFFQSMCRGSSGDMLQWALEHKLVLGSHFSDHSIFVYACKLGNIDFIRVLAAALPTPPSISLFTREYNVNSGRHRMTVLVDLCTKGLVDVLRHLAENYGLTADHLRALHNTALREACREAQLETVTYLIREMGLTREDALQKNESQAWKPSAYRAVVQEGQDKIVSFLESSLGLTQDDLSEWEEEEDDN